MFIFDNEMKRMSTRAFGRNSAQKHVQRSITLKKNILLRIALVVVPLLALLATASVSASMAVTVKIDPSSAVLVPINGVRQFNATVTGAADTSVTWSLVAPAGVDPTLIGSINSTGKYVAPANAIQGFPAITVKATSVADPTIFATNTITVRYPIPSISSITPNPLSAGPFTITVNGNNFFNGAQVLLNNALLPTTYISASKLMANGTASQLGNFTIKVANPGPSAVSTATTINVTSALTVTVSPNNLSIAPNATQQFQASVGGSANQAVTWKILGGASEGAISSTGLFTAPSTVPTGGAVTIAALAAADGVTQGTATITIQDPQAITYGRFLEQSTFGPTSQLMAHAQQIGMDAFIDEQFALPESAWPALATAQRSDAVDAFFGNAFKGQDQLRQRMIYALSEIIVIAMNKNTNGNEIVPWLQILSRNSFGNYRTLLKEITLDASMGKYLDLVNSGVGAGAPNENYPREVMQLFSIGLYQLNQDGSPKLDANGNQIPTYTQTDVQQLARALTGWTNSNATATTGSGGNYNYYPGPMIPVPGKHNTSAKTILGRAIPANQTIQQDLDSAINIIFSHPNVGPFIATRLIRALVTSNPSPAYIARVAAKFDDNGAGVKGDMKAVIKAILLDAEARNDQPPSNFGRLRTPVQSTIALARAVGMNLGQASQFNYLFYNMNEGMLDAPSVFGHYSPLYRIPKSGGIYGPEFQIFSPSDAINRANYFYSLMYNPWPINPVLQPFVNLAINPNALVNAVDNALLFGRMLPSTRTAILNALPAMSDDNQRTLTAFYLAATSGEYLVQH